MIRIFVIFTIVVSSLFANKDKITPSEVFSQVIVVQKKLQLLHKHYKKSNVYNDTGYEIRKINADLKPRNVWQKAYEVMIKMNLLRTNNGLAKIEPVNIEPLIELDPFFTYEMIRRIETELENFMLYTGLEIKDVKYVHFKNKMPIDVFNALNEISYSLDKLNGQTFSPSYVFGETIRVYEDITKLLNHLKIQDDTIPTKRNTKAKPKDTFEKSMKILNKIRQLQNNIGLSGVNFNSFQKDNITPSDVFGMVQMIISELQPIKAHYGLNGYITPASTLYKGKTPADVDQMMGWILRKTNLLYQYSIKEEY